MARFVLIALILAVIVAFFLPSGRDGGNLKRVPQSVMAQLQGHKVVLLSADWCGYCQEMKEDLREARVPFKILDVEETETGRRVYDALDLDGIPATIVDGQLVLGYDPDTVIELARK